ncbi:hypothetical protein BJX66DRAFT_132426 [Aspergillus keveii]|uniref:Uncharacterized protein n=1 Tax=Aspergillus keveii TaxID=714993 RepID=A0ABR4GC06_9EURO
MIELGDHRQARLLQEERANSFIILPRSLKERRKFAESNIIALAEELCNCFLLLNCPGQISSSLSGGWFNWQPFQPCIPPFEDFESTLLLLRCIQLRSYRSLQFSSQEGALDLALSLPSASSTGNRSRVPESFLRWEVGTHANPIREITGSSRPFFNYRGYFVLGLVFPRSAPSCVAISLTSSSIPFAFAAWFSFCTRPVRSPVTRLPSLRYLTTFVDFLLQFSPYNPTPFLFFRITHSFTALTRSFSDARTCRCKDIRT